jgi:hypothetical protein
MPDGRILPQPATKVASDVTDRMQHHIVTVTNDQETATTVWQLFGSWLRTMHTKRQPSGLVVAHAPN